MARKITQSADTLEIPGEVLEKTSSDSLALYRERAIGHSHRLNTVNVPITVAVEAAEELTKAAEALKNAKFVRALKAIVSAENGDFGIIPNISVAASIMARFIDVMNHSGWIYREREGGVQPYLITKITLLQPSQYDSGENPTLSISLRTISAFAGKSEGTTSLTLAAADVSRRSPEKILLNEGYLLETEELRAAYDKELEHYNEIISDFAEQFRYDGVPVSTADRYRSSAHRTSRVIHDLEPSARRDTHEEAESDVTGEVHPVPVMLNLPVFDLRSHEFMVVRAIGMTAYKYDKTLSDKLVLPDSHRTLMDVLTTELDAFTGDFIEDKSAGNVILCQGEPGVGKTLTAEVYAEIIERPLYSLSTVSLGLTPEKVAVSLQEVFARSKRWNAPLLLDEADVYVTQRGTDLTRDAIVAEFLKVIEYFSGLMFMTTNRSNTIDEAILSRCAAIIPYELPDKANAKLIWEKIAQINNVDLGTEMIDRLVATFPKAAPRDIKMLLRLVLRVSRANKTEITLDLFKRYAVFRSMPPAVEGEIAE